MGTPADCCTDMDGTSGENVCDEGTADWYSCGEMAACCTGGEAFEDICDSMSYDSLTCMTHSHGGDETGSGESESETDNFFVPADCCTDVDGGSGFNVCPVDDVMNEDAMTC